MAYSSTNPPKLGSQALTGGKTWHYSSTHNSTAVVATSFFANGVALGMAVEDIVFVKDNSDLLSIGCVTAVSSTGGATVGTLAIVST